MNIFLWIVQALLALVFLLHGVLFLILPARVKEELGKGNFSPAFGRFIGGAELLAAFGLLLPEWTNILPWLTPLAVVTANYGGAPGQSAQVWLQTYLVAKGHEI